MTNTTEWQILHSNLNNACLTDAIIGFDTDWSKIGVSVFSGTHFTLFQDARAGMG